MADLGDKEPFVPAATDDMVNNGKTFAETEAGKGCEGELGKARKELESLKRALEEKEAREKDVKAKEAIERDRREVQEALEEAERKRKQMEESYEHKIERLTAQMVKQAGDAADQLKEVVENWSRENHRGRRASLMEKLCGLFRRHDAQISSYQRCCPPRSKRDRFAPLSNRLLLGRRQLSIPWFDYSTHPDVRAYQRQRQIALNIFGARFGITWGKSWMSY